jgi:DNA-3-methyladenine glycosylase II
MRSFTLVPPHPFDFVLTASHQTRYRRRSGADLFDNDVYYRAFWHQNGVIPVSVYASADPVRLNIQVGPETCLADIGFVTDTIHRMFALDLDILKFYDRVAGDKELSWATQALYGLRPAQTESVFEALVEAVIGQQISANVARKIRDAVVDRYGISVEMDGMQFCSFPRPEALFEAAPEDLRSLSLSFRKVEYIKEIARRSIEGEFDLTRFGSLSKEEIIDEMIKVRGVGRWTAEWTLLRALGNVDALPAGDLALRRAVSDLYFDRVSISEIELEEFALARWAPYRGLATTYLFALLRKKRLMEGA